MSKIKELTYEERRNHIHRLIHDELDVSLREVCRWVGRESLSEYQYAWQVLSGEYGKSKRSPHVLDELEDGLKSKGIWSSYEV